jgi:hypothetical protein
MHCVGSMKPLNVTYILVAILCLSALGCSKFEAAPALQGDLSASSQCLSQATARSLAAYSVQDACENTNNYVCNSQVSGSNGETSVQSIEQCASITGWGKVCLNVDTRTVASNSGPSFHCANTEVSSPGSFLFQANADSLDQALTAVVNKCRTGSL